MDEIKNERCPECIKKGYVYCFLYPHEVPRIFCKQKIVERTIRDRVFIGLTD